jgi:hypothetical protein
MIEKNRKRMIENGTYDDYTITRNNIEIIKDADSFLRKSQLNRSKKIK